MGSLRIVSEGLDFQVADESVHLASPNVQLSRVAFGDYLALTALFSLRF